MPSGGCQTPNGVYSLDANRASPDIECTDRACAGTWAQHHPPNEFGSLHPEHPRILQYEMGEIRIGKAQRQACIRMKTEANGG